jgi:hypothetical protein
MVEFTHLDEKGRSKMVDVTAKNQQSERQWRRERFL